MPKLLEDLGAVDMHTGRELFVPGQHGVGIDRNASWRLFGHASDLDDGQANTTLGAGLVIGDELVASSTG